MNHLLIVVLLIALGFIIYQDIKYRYIHVGLPILIFGIVFYLNFQIIIFSELIKSLLFLGINFIVITAYFSVKNFKIINPFKHYVGIGDLVLLIGIIPLFPFRNYILFFITGMLFSLIMYAFFNKKYVQKTIPLAGYLSLYTMILIILKMFLAINLFIVL